MKRKYNLGTDRHGNSGSGGHGKAANCDPYVIGTGSHPVCGFVSGLSTKNGDGKDNEGEKAVKHTNALWMRSIQFAVIGFDLKFSPPNAHPLPPPPRSPLLNSHIPIPIPNMYKSKPHHSCLHAKCHHIINLIFAFSFFLQLKSPLHSSHQRLRRGGGFNR